MKPNLISTFLMFFGAALLVAQAGPPAAFFAPRAFPSPVPLQSYFTTQALAEADFNGDGKADLAVAGLVGSSVAIMLGNGNGSFQTPVIYPVGINAVSVFVADFNQDGKLDLAVVDGLPEANAGGVWILLGNGDGTFQAGTFYAADSQPIFGAAGDFNGDGKLDLVLVNSYSNDITILLGNGNGAFQKGVNYPMGGTVWPTAVAVGDFNGDHHLDLAVTESANNTVAIMLGIGDGTFQAPVNLAAGVNPNLVVAADFNGDQKLDLAIANVGSYPGTPGSVSILLGNGDGTFQAAVNYAPGAYAITLAIADFNGDGQLDLAVGNTPATRGSSGNLQILLGHGDGTFAKPVTYRDAVGAGAVAVADYNGDGKLDLAITDFSAGAISLLLGSGKGTFLNVPTFAAGSKPDSVAVGDFNGDGKPDLAVTDNGGSNIAILLGTGKGALGPPTNFTVGAAPSAIATGDFNGDGKLDLVVGGYRQPNSTIAVLLGHGDGTFQPAVNYAVAATPSFAAVGDLNGDGKLDLVVADWGSFSSKGTTISVLLGKGDGTFLPQATYSVGKSPIYVVIADFNGDGKLDVAVLNTEWSTCHSTSCPGSISMLFGNGDGTLQPQIEDFNVPYTPYAMVAADLNGDGKPDIALVAGTGSSTVSVFLNQGNGTLASPATYNLTFASDSIAVGDFNLDGPPDVAVVGSGVLSILPNSGNGTLLAPQYFAIPAGDFVAAGDFNNDGKPDLAIANNGINLVTILTNLTP